MLSGDGSIMTVEYTTSHFPIMCPIERGTSSIYVSSRLEQVVINFQRIRQVVQLFDFVIVINGRKLHTQGYTQSLLMTSD